MENKVTTSLSEYSKLKEVEKERDQLAIDLEVMEKAFLTVLGYFERESQKHYLIKYVSSKLTNRTGVDHEVHILIKQNVLD